MWTEQEMFDIVYTRFIIEGHPPASNAHGGCAYNIKGRRCAIGLFISKETAEEWDNHGGIVEVSEYLGADLFETFGFPSVDFLDMLQGLHDMMDSHSHEDNVERFAAFAKDYNLKVPTEPVEYTILD